ncbi:MAG: hypothetical protein NZ602_08705 [Thermoguttaceae bacterium]|nr:hypothetical protein [Thermoguttaceae bacterium]MDW8038939.1 hypothetical protein [Thermoguttaceae bacterium]
MGICERKKELRRRRHRREKIRKWARRLATATPSEKALIAQKIRALTPGYLQVLKNLGLEER